MNETVLSAKTSGTATKRFEVIVEVIKKKTQNFFIFLFFYAVLYLLSRTCSVFAERVTFYCLFLFMITHGVISHMV